MGKRSCVIFLALVFGLISLTFLGQIAVLTFYDGQGNGAEMGNGMDVVEKPWPVWVVTFSPDGRWIAAGRGYCSNAMFWKGGKGEVNIWKVEDWKLQNGFAAPFTIYVRALAFTPTSKHLIAAATKYIQSRPDRRGPSRVGGRPARGEPSPHDGNTIFVWAVPEGSLEQSHYFDHFRGNDKRGSGLVHSLDIHPDGERIGLSGMGKDSMVLERKTGRLVYEIGGDNGLWQNLTFSPDGKTMTSVLRSSVQLCDAGTGKKRAAFELNFGNPAQLRFGKHGLGLYGDTLTCVCYTGDGKQIAVGDSNGSVLLLSSDLTKQLRSLQISSDKEWVVGLASAPKTDLLAAATPCSVRLFETSSGKQILEWGKEDMRVSSVALSPDGKLLAVGYGGKHDAKGERRGGYLKIWDTTTGQLVKKLD